VTSRSAALSIVFLWCAGGCGSAEKEIEEPKGPELSAAELTAQGAQAEEADRLAEAEDAYRRAITADPKLYEPNQKLVALLIATARPAEAVEVARAYLAARPEDLRANHLVADAHLAAGAYGEVDAVLSAVLADDDSDSMALEKRARARILAGDLARGEEDYRRALEIDAENIEYMVGLGSVLIRRGEKAEAKEWLGKVLAKNEEHPRANVLMGIVYRESLELDDALRHHLRAVRVAPESARAQFELGITQNLRGDNVAAERNLGRAVQLEPNDAINWYAYGEALRILEKYGEAAAAYKRALEIDPNHGKAPNKLGFVLFKLGDVDEAEVVLTAAVRANPDDPYPYFNLGMVYGKGEKHTLAINSFLRFLELAPKDDKDVPVARRQIALLRRELRRSR
jgi:tetratricopeptide (TPR) repeat protein